MVLGHPDLVQEQRVLVRQLKASELRRQGSGEGTRSWPNSSVSSSPAGRAAQFPVTKGRSCHQSCGCSGSPCRRGERYGLCGRNAIIRWYRWAHTGGRAGPRVRPSGRGPCQLVVCQRDDRAERDLTASVTTLMQRWGGSLFPASSGIVATFLAGMLRQTTDAGKDGAEFSRPPS